MKGSCKREQEQVSFLVRVLLSKPGRSFPGIPKLEALSLSGNLDGAHAMDRRSRECRMKGNKSRYGPLSTSSGELFRTVNNDMSSGTTSFSDPNARQVKCTRKCIYMNVRSPNYRRLNYRSNLKFLLSIFMFARHPPTHRFLRRRWKRLPSEE